MQDRVTHLWARGRNRVNDVAAVELSPGQEVQRSGEHANPSRNADRVQIQIAQ